MNLSKSIKEARIENQDKEIWAFGAG